MVPRYRARQPPTDGPKWLWTSDSLDETSAFMRAPVRTLLILAATVLTWAVPSADAVNITGTWVGTMVCDLVAPENPHFRQVTRDVVIEIVMDNNYRFALESQDVSGPSRPMLGPAVDDGRLQNQGKVAAQSCTPNLAVSYFLTADAVVNDLTGGSTFNGTLIDVLTNSPGYVQTCRIAFRGRPRPVPSSTRVASSSGRPAGGITRRELRLGEMTGTT
jgi:hypothetical protein